MKGKAKGNFSGGMHEGKRVSFKAGETYDLSRYPVDFIKPIMHQFEVEKSKKETAESKTKKETATRLEQTIDKEVLKN